MAQNKTIVTVHGEQIGYDARITTLQRDALPKTVGLMIFNIDTNCHEFWDGTGWYNYCWGGKTKPLNPGEVLGAAGKIWMDKNLGATQVATSSTDHLSYGALYQWGRGSDGHELVNWTSGTLGTPKYGNTATLSATDNPGNNLFITINGAPADWRSTQNNNLWQGVSGTNNPCPSGYRLPTGAELTAEFNAAGITNSATAFNSPLKFPAAGLRHQQEASIENEGTYGYYWVSTVSGAESFYRFFNSTVTATTPMSRAHGFSVRCIKD